MAFFVVIFKYQFQIKCGGGRQDRCFEAATAFIQGRQTAQKPTSGV